MNPSSVRDMYVFTCLRVFIYQEKHCCGATRIDLKNNSQKGFIILLKFFPIKDFLKESNGLEGLSLVTELVCCIGVEPV